jgi:hypothetical protein
MKGILDDDEDDELVKMEKQIIGYVTSGNYSLSRGKAYAIGAVPLAKFLELQERATRCVPIPSLISPLMSSCGCVACVSPSHWSKCGTGTGALRVTRM